MVFVSARVQSGSDMSSIHAANAVYALNEIRGRRAGLVAAGVLWGRVVRVREIVPVGTSRVLEVGVLVGGSGPGAFRAVKAWNEAADVFAPLLLRDFSGLFVGEWRAAVGRDGRLRHWLDLWGVYEGSDDPRRFGRPLGATQDGVVTAVLAEE
jgi:hypothetical protein